MERMTSVKFVYVPRQHPVPTPSGALSADEAKRAAIDYLLKRFVLKPTE